MKKNINKLGGLHKSQKILLALSQKGLSREIAYEIVQSAAMESWNNDKRFEDIINNSEKIKKYLDQNELNDILTRDEDLGQIDWIFKNKF